MYKYKNPETLNEGKTIWFSKGGAGMSALAN
jgi:hypothetical protein